MAVTEKDDFDTVPQPGTDAVIGSDAQKLGDKIDMAIDTSIARANKRELDKIEIDNVGSALAKKFSQLDEDQQAQVLSNIGLVQEKTSPKDAFKSLSDEERKAFMEETGSKKMNLIQSAGKAFSNLSEKLETNIEKVMNDPGKRALLYSGLDPIDK